MKIDLIKRIMCDNSLILDDNNYLFYSDCYGNFFSKKKFDLDSKYVKTALFKKLILNLEEHGVLKEKDQVFLEEFLERDITEDEYEKYKKLRCLI